MGGEPSPSPRPLRGSLPAATLRLVPRFEADTVSTALCQSPARNPEARLPCFPLRLHKLRAMFMSLHVNMAHVCTEENKLPSIFETHYVAHLLLLNWAVAGWYGRPASRAAGGREGRVTQFVTKAHADSPPGTSPGFGNHWPKPAGCWASEKMEEKEMTQSRRAYGLSPPRFAAVWV